MIIATDIDEVLADTLNEFLGFYNADFRTNFSREQFKSYDWWEGLNVSLDDFILRLNRFIDKEGFARILPLPGAREAIKKLGRDHKLLVVTSRPRAIAETTARWLEKHFPGCFKEVYYTKELIGEKNRVSKAAFCLQEGAELFIDDVYEHAAGCAARGIETLLYDAPWNRETALISNMARVASWEEVVKIVDERVSQATAVETKVYSGERIKI